MSTAVDEVIAALVARFTAALPDVRVFDGPPATTTPMRDWLIVGSDGDDGDAAEVDQAESSLGPGGWVDESGEVTCSAWSFSGSTDVATRRAGALAVVEACEAALSADPSLGGLLVAGRARSAPSRLRLNEQQVSGGALARVVFTVTYTTTITT